MYYVYMRNVLIIVSNINIKTEKKSEKQRKRVKNNKGRVAGMRLPLV